MTLVVRRWVLVGALVLVACGGAVHRGADDEGGTVEGGATGLGGTATGGRSPNAGGTAATLGTGGTSGTPGIGGSGASQCDVVGCAPAPLCAEGCGFECGCCPCAEGEVMDIAAVKHECIGGCWAPVDAACEWLGRFHAVGATFAAENGCDTCLCEVDGTVGCTAEGCPPCNPGAERNQRQYVTTDPLECELIDYVCAGATTSFSNECGCGCEQDPDCPNYIDCMPGGADARCSDLEAFELECPFSDVAW